MTVRIDQKKARAILYEEAAKAMAGYVEKGWAKAIEELSEAASAGNCLTHIAFLGTAILAKCVHNDVDVFSVKGRAGPQAYSARSLAKDVLAQNAPELDISLGVSGREPLNNQPYFRIERLTRDAPVRSTARPALNLLCDILDRLSDASAEQARQALRAFIDVRRRYGLRYTRSVPDQVVIGIDELAEAITSFVRESSEGGRRAQAVVAGLMDLLAGRERVDARRVNDPSRSVPADVNVRSAHGEGWERVIEVRDKPVTREDLYVLMDKCRRSNAEEAVIVAASPSAALSLVPEAQAWGAERGVSLTVFDSWPGFVRQALHWSAVPSLKAAGMVPALVERRLVDLEVSQETMESWSSLSGASDPRAGSGEG